jgi:hypothetical protein
VNNEVENHGYRSIVVSAGVHPGGRFWRKLARDARHAQLSARTGGGRNRQTGTGLVPLGRSDYLQRSAGISPATDVDQACSGAAVNLHWWEERRDAGDQAVSDNPTAGKIAEVSLAGTTAKDAKTSPDALGSRRGPPLLGR